MTQTHGVKHIFQPTKCAHTQIQGQNTQQRKRALQQNTGSNAHNNT